VVDLDGPLRRSDVAFALAVDSSSRANVIAAVDAVAVAASFVAAVVVNIGRGPPRLEVELGCVGDTDDDDDDDEDDDAPRPQLILGDADSTDGEEDGAGASSEMASNGLYKNFGGDRLRFGATSIESDRTLDIEEVAAEEEGA